MYIIQLTTLPNLYNSRNSIPDRESGCGLSNDDNLDDGILICCLYVLQVLYCIITHCLFWAGLGCLMFLSPNESITFTYICFANGFWPDDCYLENMYV